MTILPKKKSKDKVLVPNQQQQHSDHGGSDSDTDPAHKEGGAAGGHPSSLEGDHLTGYHYTSSTNYYDRQYSSGESSPELPVNSKVRGSRNGGSAQKKIDPAHPESPNYSGYNSGEEYDGSIIYYNEEKERLFEGTLKQERGLIIRRMRPDGACLFRSVADQVYGDQEMHSVVRHNCMEYMSKNSEYFSQFVTEDFERYINRKRSDRCYGNNLEMQAIAEMYNRCIEVYQYSTEPINTFFGVYKTDNPPIRLSYHRGVHYNSVVDPHEATVGVGLGLAGHKPGIADKNLLSKAKKESEMVYLEKSMLEDKLMHSEWETTCEAVEQAVARESYLMWLREQEQKTQGTVGESSHQTCLSPSHDVGVVQSHDLPSLSSPSILTTTKSINTHRARSRSRSLSRSQSPATAIPRRSSLKEGRSLSSPKLNRSSPRSSNPSSRRTSPLHSPRVSPDGSPRSSPLANHRIKDGSGSPHSRSLPHSPSPTQALTPPTNNIVNTSPRLQGSPHVGVDYESGSVLSQLPYEYNSSFIDLPPSAFGLVSWENEEDPELIAVLVASQKEYLDELKRSSSNSNGAESL